MGLFDANNVKCAEVRKLVEEQQYKKALGVLEKVNINKVKSMADLNIFAHVYQKNRMYEEARDILYRIYEKKPNKRVIYKLVYLAILVSDFEEAEALYEEYVEVAEGTVEQYILRYGLDKAQRKDYMVRLKSLVKIKELDYTEEWAYELAKTYHKAGMAQECIDECSNIILWFGKGKIVEKARLLKAYYEDGVEVLQSYGITLNEEGQYYYDEATAQAYYQAKHPMTSAGQNTQNLSAQISYITEQQRQMAIHNELTRDLEPTMNIQQAIMEETGINPAFQEDLQHMIGDNADTAEIRYKERATRDRQAQEVEKIRRMEAERQERELQRAQQEAILQQERELQRAQQQPSAQEMYEEQLLDLSNMAEPNIDEILQEQKRRDTTEISTTELVGDIFKEFDQKLEETLEAKIKPKRMKKNKKRFSFFSGKNKEGREEEQERLIQLPRDETRLMIEQEEEQEEARRQEEIRRQKEVREQEEIGRQKEVREQEEIRRQKEVREQEEIRRQKEIRNQEEARRKQEEAAKWEEEFSDDTSHKKNIFKKIRRKTIKAKEENAAIEKEQNILASLTEKPLLKKEWNGSIEVPEELEPPKETEHSSQEAATKEKKVTKSRMKPLTKKEWLEKTVEVSQKIEESKKGEFVIGETISIKIKPKDITIVIDGIDLTDNFGSYAEQPRIRAQLLKELTRMKEGEQPLHIILNAKDDDRTMEFVKSLGRAIEKLKIMPSHRIASIDAEKLNKIQLSDKQNGLRNSYVAVRNAGKITADTAQSILNMIQEFGEEVIVILVDENSSLDFLMVEYPALAKYFKYNLTI